LAPSHSHSKIAHPHSAAYTVWTLAFLLWLPPQVFKFAQYIGAKSLAGRHTPGTFTNQIQKQFEEPRLLILTGAPAAAAAAWHLAFMRYELWLRLVEHESSS
jgi:hypothetical protein